MSNEHITNVGKVTGDALAASITVGTLVEFLPAIAALLTIFWTAIRIYETETVQRLLSRDEPEED